MKSKIGALFRKAADAFLHRKEWRRVVSTLACIVVFITVYALILPAITAEHRILECGVEVHSHDQTCYDESGALICGKVDCVVHTHDDNCYDSDGKLICELPEIQEHQHTDSCYEEVDGKKVLTCGKDEIIVHQHDENCYDKDGNLICDQTEVLSHQHDDSCFVTVDDEEDYGIMMLAEDGDGSSDSSSSTTDGISFRSYVTDVMIQYRKYDTDIWHDLTKVDGVYPITSDMQLRFQLTYNLPEYTLSEDNSTILYQLPKEIRIREEETGIVTNTGGAEIGTYTIDTNGLISITFTDPDYIAGNSSSNLIGYIAFNMRAEDIDMSNPDSEGIDFADGVTVKVDVTDVYDNSEDLQVTKTQSSINEETGEITYTVTVTSKGGTSEAVTLTDMGFTSLANLVNTGKITVADSKGNTTEVDIESVSDGFSLTLPAMDANSTYTMTYSVKVTDMVFTGSKTVQNTVTVESKDKDGKRIKDTSSTDHTFEKKLLSKTGTVSKDGTTVSWTITVNEDGDDISQWVLSDVFNQKDYTGSVTLKDSKGNTQTVTLPYTFPDGSKDTYTITYTTANDVAMGSSKVSNVATLTAPDGGGPITADGSGTIPDGEAYNPLDKKAEGYEDSEDGKTADITWKVTINADRGPIEADQTIDNSSAGGNVKCWYYFDDLWNEQYFTKDQLTAFKASVLAALSDGMTDDDVIVEVRDNNWSWTEVSSVSDDFTCRYIRILFKKELAQGQKIEFSYDSTAPIENLTSAKTYRNNATINDKVYDNDSVIHPANTWSVTKVDQMSSGDSTAHNVTGLSKNSAGNPVLAWTIKVTAPEGATGDFTVTETLPEGTTADYIELRAEADGFGISSLNPLTSDGEWLWVYGNGTNQYQVFVNYDRDTNTYSFKLPEDLLQKTNTFYFVIKVTIDDLTVDDNGAIDLKEDVVWEENEAGDLTKSYQNSVTVETSNSTPVAIAEQTQILTADNPYKIVQKTHDAAEEGSTYTNNIIPYEVVINPLKLDLVSGDILTFTDTLTYDYWTWDNSGSYSVSLVNSSFTVYYEDEQGEWQQLDNSAYSFNYDTDYISSGNHEQGTLTLTAKVPDSTKLKITYKYQVTGQYVNGATLNNTAEITGTTANGVKDEDQAYMRVQTSSAGIQMSGVDFVKVDAENNNIILEGAEFDLYKWSASANDGAGGYVFLCNCEDGMDNGNDRVNYANGIIDITNLDLNTAYMLIETKAPAGYVLDDTPYEFYVAHQGSDDFIGPTDFTGDCLLGGTQIYIPNRKNDASIEVVKNWKSYEGYDTDSPSVESVKFTLYQHASTDENATIDKSNYKDDTNLGTFTIKPDADGNWTWSSDNEDTLSGKIIKTATDENGNVVYYSYYVVEEESPYYLLVAEENNDGISDGTITLTNQDQEKTVYNLPQTGGIGPEVFKFAGILIVLTASGLIVLQLKKHGED